MFVRIKASIVLNSLTYPCLYVALFTPMENYSNYEKEETLLPMFLPFLCFRLSIKYLVLKLSKSMDFCQESKANYLTYIKQQIKVGFSYQKSRQETGRHYISC
jgi:hypothetical protein